MFATCLARTIPLLCVFSVASVIGQDATTETQPTETQPTTDARAGDRMKIEAAIESYVTAFNAKDVDKLLALWSPNGVYVARTSGERLTGHEALKEEFTAILSAESAPKLAVQTESIEFISPSVALERGSATILSGEDVREQTVYQVVYVKDDGKWLIDRVSEDTIINKPSNYEHLQGLEFLVGQWVVDSDSAVIELDCQWTKNQNYLSRKYAVVIDGETDSSGLQIIGWDGKNKQIKSWLFDSDGGFVKGTWEQRDGTWIVQSVATLADGATGSSTSVYRSLNENAFAWRKIDQIVAGELLPNTDEVTVRRK